MKDRLCPPWCTSDHDSPGRVLYHLRPCYEGPGVGGQPVRVDLVCAHDCGPPMIAISYEHPEGGTNCAEYDVAAVRDLAAAARLARAPGYAQALVDAVRLLGREPDACQGVAVPAPAALWRETELADDQLNNRIDDLDQPKEEWPWQ